MSLCSLYIVSKVDSLSFLFVRLLRYHAAAVSRAIAQRTEFSNRAIESAIVVERVVETLGFLQCRNVSS